jgi:hypothetical protein
MIAISGRFDKDTCTITHEEYTDRNAEVALNFSMAGYFEKAERGQARWSRSENKVSVLEDSRAMLKPSFVKYDVWARRFVQASD